MILTANGGKLRLRVMGRSWQAYRKLVAWHLENLSRSGASDDDRDDEDYDTDDLPECIRIIVNNWRESAEKTNCSGLVCFAIRCEGCEAFYS